MKHRYKKNKLYKVGFNMSTALLDNITAHKSGETFNVYSTVIEVDGNTYLTKATPLLNYVGCLYEDFENNLTFVTVKNTIVYTYRLKVGETEFISGFDDYMLFRNPNGIFMATPKGWKKIRD